MEEYLARHSWRLRVEAGLGPLSHCSLPLPGDGAPPRGCCGKLEHLQNGLALQRAGVVQAVFFIIFSTPIWCMKSMLAALQQLP